MPNETKMHAMRFCHLENPADEKRRKQTQRPETYEKIMQPTMFQLQKLQQNMLIGNGTVKL